MPVNCSMVNVMRIEDFPNPLSPTERAALAAMYCISAVCSIVGNLWTLFTIPRRVYQTLYKCCLFSLSLSDLLLGVFVTLDNTMRLISQDIGWLLGDVMCKAVPLLTTTSILASSFSLTCVAADRYHGLAWLREQFKPSITTSILAMLVVWGISFGASIHMFFMYTSKELCIVDLNDHSSPTFVCKECTTLCLSEMSQYQTYFTCLYAAIFVPLLIVFLLSYGMIAWRVWGARRQIGRSNPMPSTTTSSTEAIASNTSLGQKLAKTAHAKKKIRTFKVVLIIMATFVVCRLPQWTFTLITLNNPVVGASAYLAKYSLSVLTVFNTAVNPLLYSFLDSILDIQCLLFRCLRKT